MRQRLPNRRPNQTIEVEWDGRLWTLSIGYSPEDYTPREVFANGAKIGSGSQAIVDDACVIISLLLQHGISADALKYHLAREGADPRAPYASILGLITEELANAV